MRVVEHVAERAEPGEELLAVEASAGLLELPLGEGEAVDVFHHDRRAGRVVLEGVRAHDGRMRERHAAEHFGAQALGGFRAGP